MSMNDDTALEQRLTEQGQLFRSGFLAPELGPMVELATEPAGPRRRWVWPLLAAVLLLAVPLITVLAIHRHDRAPSTPPATTSTGPSLQLLGDESWSDPVLQPGGRSVAVQADVNTTPGGYCLDEGLPVLKPVVTESATSVRIVVKAYRRLPRPSYSVPAGSVLGCSAVGHVPVTVVATLDAPLGSRTVQGGRAGSLYDASGFATPSYLPPGFRGGAVTAQDGTPLRIYQNGNEVLSISPNAFRYRGPQSPRKVATGIVHGHPAEVFLDPAPQGNECVLWTEQSQPWSVCSMDTGASAKALAPSELIKVANSLH